MIRRYIGCNGTRAEALDVLQMDTESLASVAEKISYRPRARGWSPACTARAASWKLSRRLAAARTTVAV